jgi:hypothetical protein
MRRKKVITEPVWLMWEGDDFPRKLDSDSLVFYLNEHIYLDSDDIAKKSLARQLQREGIVSSLFEGYNLINLSWISRAGFYFDDGDERFPIYCDESNSNYEWDATFVEVPYVL